MGGDGGVVATNRKYMRGAGTADHTGDYGKSQQAQSFNALEAMSTCALTKGKINMELPIVACPYGKLYQKEAAVQALLRRKTHKDEDSLGSHIRKLSDLYDVRFHYENTKPTCPVTSKALNGTIPAILLVPGKPDTPNVLSESAFSSLSTNELEEEYGPIQRKVRLAPPNELLKEIKKQVQEEQLKESLEKKQKKDKKKKRKREESSQNEKPSKDRSKSSGPKSATAGAARSRVESAIQSNKVLSSIFTTKKSISEKEHKDNLFAR